MGGRGDVTDFRREIIPLLWNTVKERALVKYFSFNMGIINSYVDEAAWCTQWEDQRDRQEMSQRRNCDIQLTVCSLFWLGPITSEVLIDMITFACFENQLCFRVLK